VSRAGRPAPRSRASAPPARPLAWPAAPRRGAAVATARVLRRRKTGA